MKRRLTSGAMSGGGLSRTQFAAAVSNADAVAIVTYARERRHACVIKNYMQRPTMMHAHPTDQARRRLLAQRMLLPFCPKLCTSVR